jgi:hypothetical protein
MMGFIAFAGLALLSLAFYKERMIFSDASFYLFTMVKDNGFAIFHNRFIAVIPQLLPSLAVKLSLTLQTIMVLYSLSFILYAAFLYVICGSFLKDKRHALVILMIQFLITADTFYWTLSELPLGLILMVCLFSLLSQKQNKIFLCWVVLIVLMPVLAFSHPFILLPFSFSVFYYWQRGELPKSMLVGATALLIAILLGKAFFFYDPYDKGSLGGLRNFISLFPDYFGTYSNKQFLKDTLGKYVWIPVSLISIATIYWRKGEWKLLILVIGYNVATILFINVCFPFENTPSFYRENLYLTVGLYLGLPLVDTVLPALHRRSIGAVLLLLIAATGMIRIYHHHIPFTQRLGYLRGILSKYKREKVIIPESTQHLSRLKLTWGSPFELWLLSTTDHGYTASIVITDNPAPLVASKDNTKIWMNAWAPTPYELLPPRYFILGDTVTGYTLESN